MSTSLLKLVYLSLIGIMLLVTGAAKADPNEDAARRMFENITGVPFAPGDGRLAQMKAQIAAGNLKAAAAIATDDSSFYNVTLVNWTSRMFGKEESPLSGLTDFQALMIGTIRDDLDARGILTGNYLYYGTPSSTGNTSPSLSDNNHYAALSSVAVDLKVALTRRTPQWPGFQESAGVFTTRGWAASHYDAGTNRRAVEYAFREFMCAPISQWKDTGLPTDRIRRDVDRAPGGNPSTFQSLCRNCHAPMDGMAGAFSHLDFQNGALVHYGLNIAPKYNQNTNVYPEGYMTETDSWVNYATQNQNAAFGWRGEISGSGISSFALMLANSQGFKQCMTRRTFREVCHRDPNQDDQTEVNRLSEQFEADGYNLKGLFQNVAISSRCM